MAKFRVAIIRTETQVFTVEAENSSEAIEKVSDALDEGMIELVDPDTCDTDFSLIGHADENVRASL
ncbi:MAG: hypothetical protein II876_11320 [Synergistaceae bacterium]|nr:hypothetical protein [Synergistaceae bacterium]